MFAHPKSIEFEHSEHLSPPVGRSDYGSLARRFRKVFTVMTFSRESPMPARHLTLVSSLNDEAVRPRRLLTQNSELKRIGVWNWTLPAWAGRLPDGCTIFSVRVSVKQIRD